MVQFKHVKMFIYSKYVFKEKLNATWILIFVDIEKGFNECIGQVVSEKCSEIVFPLLTMLAWGQHNNTGHNTLTKWNTQLKRQDSQHLRKPITKPQSTTYPKINHPSQDTFTNQKRTQQNRKHINKPGDQCLFLLPSSLPFRRECSVKSNRFEEDIEIMRVYFNGGHFYDVILNAFNWMSLWTLKTSLKEDRAAIHKQHQKSHLSSVASLHLTRTTVCDRLFNFPTKSERQRDH